MVFKNPFKNWSYLILCIQKIKDKDLQICITILKDTLICKFMKANVEHILLHESTEQPDEFLENYIT